LLQVSQEGPEKEGRKRSKTTGSKRKLGKGSKLTRSAVAVRFAKDERHDEKPTKPRGEEEDQQPPGLLRNPNPTNNRKRTHHRTASGPVSFFPPPGTLSSFPPIDEDIEEEEEEELLLSTLLDSYDKMRLPHVGRKATLPHSNITFERFSARESQAQWAFPNAVAALSIDSILTLATALLLERKVVVTGSSLKTLSSATLIGPTLIHPFEYQSVFLPLLPLTLTDYFLAPVPYLLGFMDELTPDLKDMMDDVLFLDTDKNEFSGNLSFPPLPNVCELKNSIKTEMRRLRRLKTEMEDGARPPAEQAPLVRSLLLRFSDYFDELLSENGIRKHCVRDLTNPDPISAFMRESFLLTCPEKDQPFFEAFFDTQIFNHYLDGTLRSLDVGPKNRGHRRVKSVGGFYPK